MSQRPGVPRGSEGFVKCSSSDTTNLCSVPLGHAKDKQVSLLVQIAVAP